MDAKIISLFLQNKEVLLDEIQSRDKDGHHSLYNLLRHNVLAPYSNIKTAVSKFVDLVLPKLVGSSASTDPSVQREAAHFYTSFEVTVYKERREFQLNSNKWAY